MPGHIDDFKLTKDEKALYDVIPKSTYGTPKPGKTLTERKYVDILSGSTIEEVIVYLGGLQGEGFSEIGVEYRESNHWCYECGGEDEVLYYVERERPLTEEEEGLLAQIEVKIRETRRKKRESQRLAKDKRIKELEKELEKLKGVAKR